MPNSYKIVSDSSSNLFSLADVAYQSVPLKIICGDMQYVDDQSLDVESMIDALKVTKNRSGTSCPNVNDWLSAFEGHDRIFAITITGSLSGSWSTAMKAREQYLDAHPDARIHIIDSLSTGPEMALIIERLRRGILDGMEFDALAEDITHYQEHTRLLFCLQSLNNLARNGRISAVKAKVMGALGLRIVGRASEQGTLQPLHKARGEEKAVACVVDEMVNMGYNGGRVRISYCRSLGAAKKIAATVAARFPDAPKAVLEPCTALCSFYAEEGGYIVGFEIDG